MQPSPLPANLPGVSFRPFGPDDYEALAAIRRETYPDAPPSPEVMRHEDSLWDGSKYWRSRVIAFADGGAPVAYGDVTHMPWQWDPDRYATGTCVVPSARGRGIGRAIAAWVEEVARARGAVSVRSEVKADDERSLAFAARREYVDRQRNWESRLDVGSFDDATFAGHEVRVATDGIVIRTLADLLASASGEAREAILAEYYALDLAATEDEPSLDPITPSPFETWRGFVLEGPDSLPDATFLAIDAGRMVGLCALFRNLGVPGVLAQGFTAVARSHRGRGVAQALKLRTVTYARANGYHEIRTWNNSRNGPMLRINEAMGFAKQPVWVTVVRSFDAAPSPGTGALPPTGA